MKKSMIVLLMFLVSLLITGGCNPQPAPLAPAPTSTSTPTPVNTIVLLNKIAFSRMDVSDTQIFVMDANGSNVVNITNDFDFNTRPAWSPDGLKIAYGGINVMNANGSNIVNIGSGIEPAWSPDGSKIAYVTGIHNQIYVMNADGSNPVDLSNNTLATYSWPTWSPDGTKIAFMRNYDISLLSKIN